MEGVYPDSWAVFLREGTYFPLGAHKKERGERKEKNRRKNRKK